jgi:hypothetical protein
MCINDNYKKCKRCQCEAEYVLLENKIIVVLILEKGYTPDGWSVNSYISHKTKLI